MQWGRTHEPCRQTALRQAQYAYTKYIEGTEKAYLVEGAIADLIAAYDIESLDAIIYARLSLKEEDEGEKQRLMAIALKDVLTRRKVWWLHCNFEGRFLFDRCASFVEFLY